MTIILSILLHTPVWPYIDIDSLMLSCHVDSHNRSSGQEFSMWMLEKSNQRARDTSGGAASKSRCCGEGKLSDDKNVRGLVKAQWR